MTENNIYPHMYVIKNNIHSKFTDGKVETKK